MPIRAGAVVRIHEGRYRDRHMMVTVVEGGLARGILCPVAGDDDPCVTVELMHTLTAVVVYETVR